MEKREVKIKVTLDGKYFAEAKFENGFAVKDGYTVLDSSTGNIFVHLIRSSNPGNEFGSLFKSNWNGTFYHKTIDYVNQNRGGYIDFEKVHGINGTMIINTITNVDGMQHGEQKELATMLSTNDGN